ncbi:hypothetical protein [Thalassobacillus pellis]|uniref:hypothetical protein n=1 Tax=Thalassobacillus pellis TaxID=748008 RepID=UPI00196228D4|nr:hypothetical protein [Thalassobacillus pellis]MBM7554541.1 hypothetical protein [Thalassobacillus pellis]
MSRIGKNKKDKGQVTPPSESERIQGQIARGEVRAGPEAAREIAAKIEAKGGFWGPRQ